MATLVTQQAPHFVKPAVFADGKIEDYDFQARTKNKYALVFFYPLDFTFVCPTEIIALNRRMSEFKARGIEVIAVSIDSQFTHAAFRKQPIQQGGIGEVEFPLIADVDHSICRAYGVEHPVGVAFRAAFLVDKKGIIQSEIVNNLPLGRNVDEILRLFDAIQFHEQHGEVCPAGWKKGDVGMKASTEGVASYLSEHSEEL